MNGFEPLRRRIIDYTEAGQWSEVYDGPLEDCESEKLKAENAKLLEERDMYRDLVDCMVHPDIPDQLAAENAKLRELVADMWFWRYEGHIDSESQERQMLHIDAVIQRMRELGVGIYRTEDE